MTKTKGTPGSLTEAQTRQRFTIVMLGGYRTQSNSRIIPYAEIYRGRSSMMETPAQYLQRAAEEEQVRIRRRQPASNEQKA